MYRYCRGLLLAASAMFLGCGESPGRFNPASLESETLQPQLAPPETALTLAQVRASDGSVDTLLVTGFEEEDVQAVVLSSIGATQDDDPFAVLSSVSREEILAAARDESISQTFRIRDLLPAGGPAERHVASGTNFPEHAAEANSNLVFNFPKFGPATPARTTVAYHPDVLLDYEVEICMRFDRDIARIEDFDAAVKGFFLCGDFTDRAELLRLVDADNFDSGSGFSDAKSGADYFPTGPFLVIPEDWRSFVSEERIVTLVGDTITQDARGGEMTLDFRELTEKVLGDVTSERFLYQDEYYRLVADGFIPRNSVLMSGTAEGVIFMGPTTWEIVKGAVHHVTSGALLTEQSGYRSVIEHFIEMELASGRYLQPGETVSYQSGRMGTVRIDVEEASGFR